MVKLKSSVKKQKKSVLNKTIDFFIHSSYRAFLVGGYVRDATLGLQPVDIDIVIEGDAIKIARELNKKLHGKLTAHKNFGTASIDTQNVRVDLASARLEKYPSPATLPHVRPATIVEDLNRRDFTINAMAMSISKGNFGEIFDPFGGLEDINKGIIRVLHKNSFTDDPTRIFRALRYKNRFGFRIEKRTMQLLKDAITQRLLKKLTGQRLLNEIRLIFNETNFHNILRELSILGIFKVRRNQLAQLERVKSHVFYYYVSLLKSHTLPLRRDEHKIVHEFHKIDYTAKRLEKTSTRSGIYAILSSISIPTREVLVELKPFLRNKIKTYQSISKIKPFVTGNDLKRYKFKPGNKYRSLLKKIWDMQLDKKITSRKQALDYLRTQRKRG